MKITQEVGDYAATLNAPEMLAAWEGMAAESAECRDSGEEVYVASE